jgi:hypothetical protein
VGPSGARILAFLSSSQKEKYDDIRVGGNILCDQFPMLLD